MVLLDNDVYVTNACGLLSSAPGYRVIPLMLSCFTGSSTIITSILNIISIFCMLYLLFRTFRFEKNISFWATIIFGFNAYVSFPYFYAAAHSYVYSIMAAIVSLFVLDRMEKIDAKSLGKLFLCALFLKLVRSEGPLYFLISYIAYLIFYYIQSKDLKNFWEKIKLNIKAMVIMMGFVLLINFVFPLFLSPGERIAKNLQENKYSTQFPKESFYAVAIWATLDYLKAFILPFLQSFFGNYADWLTIHLNKTYQYILYAFLLITSGLSTYFIFRKNQKIYSYLVIAMSIFIIPGFLISSFLRNQWFYPSRALLGCYLCLPFLIVAYQKIKSHKSQMTLARCLVVISFISFFIHDFWHYRNPKTIFNYESKFLGLDHPTVNKMYAQDLYHQKDFKTAKQILSPVDENLPDAGIFLSANHFFLHAENLYWLGITSYLSQDIASEEKALRKLYKYPNFFAGIACLQDERIPLDSCLHPAYLKELCNPVYAKRFGISYYKKPRLTADKACAQQQN